MMLKVCSLCEKIRTSNVIVFGIVVLQSIVLLAFRANWGWQFFVTGKGKLLNHERVVSFFSTLGIPAPEFNAWIVGGVECIGGLFLLVGLFSRPVGLILSGNMLVAYLSVAEDRTTLLNVFSDPEPFLNADPFYFFLTAVLVLAFGPGLVSIDRLAGWFFRKKASRASCCGITKEG